MRRLMLIALLFCSCSFKMKHEWKNGLTCKCKAVFTAAEATCVCEPNNLRKCETQQPIAQKTPK